MFANPLVELVPFWNRFYFTISELSSQNRDFNSLLCEIFTNLTVKFEKSGIQSYFMRLTNRLVLAVNRQSRLPIFEGYRDALYKLCSQNIMFQKHNIVFGHRIFFDSRNQMAIINHTPSDVAVHSAGL